jgi:hypothetical protein
MTDIGELGDEAKPTKPVRIPDFSGSLATRSG